MATIEIERDDWKPFLDSFTRRHDGWLVTVEVLAPDLGDQIEIDNLPLRGLSCEALAQDHIEINVDSENGHITRSIETPRHMWLKQTEPGTDEVLEIVADDATTLIKLRKHPPLA